MSTLVRQQPHNLEAEKYVLACILIDEDAILKVAPILKSDNFYDSKHAQIYTAMLRLFEKGQSIDHILIKEEMRSQGYFKKADAEYLIDLTAILPTASRVEEYCHIVRETAVRRRLLTLSSKLGDLAYNEKSEISEIMNEVEKDVFMVSEQNIKRDFVHVRDLLEKSYELAEKMAKNKGAIRGVATGFPTLTGMLGGFQNSDLIILGARPSVGKTSFALDLARYAAIDDKRKVAFFALEMSAQSLVDRLTSMQTGIGLWDLRNTQLKASQLDKIAIANGVLAESDMYIDDTAGINITELRTKCRRLKMESGLDIIFIDYLQLIIGNNKESRTQEVSEISRQLKNIARELDVPIIALSQLSRAVESRNDKRPQLSDLRESGSIEQDADIVMFLHREDMYNAEPGTQGKSEIIIAKHRNGPTGEIALTFVKELARYREPGK